MIINGNRISKTVTADTSVTIYAGCVVTIGVYGNRTTNAITNFKIGTTNGGSEVYLKATLPSFGVETLNKSDLAKQFFSIDTDTTLYITADNWNSAILGITLFFEPII